MAAEREVKLNSFLYGMNEQERDLPNGYYLYLENVELKAKGAKQVANNVVSITDYNLRAVLDIAGTIYGLGWYSGNSKVGIWVDLAGTPNLSQPATLYSASGKANPFFVTDGTYIYYDNANKIGRYTISGGSQNGDWASISGGLSGGVMWNKYLYGFQGQDVYVVDTTGATVTKMVSVPAGQTIVQLVPYGQLLAVICTSSVNEAYMFLCDGVNVTATPWYDDVKIGLGTVFGASLLDGVITVFINLKNYKGIRIKKYNGNVFTTEYTYYGRKNLAGNKYVSGASKVKSYTNYVYFITFATRPNSASDYEYQIMRYGREDVNKPFNLSVYKSFEIATGNSIDYNDFVIIEDTSPSPTTPMTSVYATILTASNVTTYSHNLKSGVFTSQPGAVETSILTLDDSATTKHFKVCALHFAPLTSGQSVTLKYKKDEETTWTTMGTANTVGDVHYHINNIEGTGASAPNFNEISFRFELLGGAELTGFRIKEEDLEDIYG